MTAPVLSSLAPCGLPQQQELLTPAARRGVLIAIGLVHLSGVWALLQVESARLAVAEAAPLFVQWVAPPAPLAPATPPPPKAIKPPPPAPIIASKPVRVAEAAQFVVPPPPQDPPAPQVFAAAEPAPAPVATSTPPAPSPKMVPATAVEYLDPPAVRYPPLARRLGESGRVVLRVLIAADGRPGQVELARSSGHERLDEAALGAMRAARFKPYTENGVAQAVWTLAPIAFNLEN